ncbi:TetR/AcrR family transcriptional regulator, partial [Acinetobacter baumannii]
MKITYKQTFIMRHREILRTTEKLLIENYDDITIDELALELDVAKGTIYKHFKSKNQLYLELLI